MAKAALKPHASPARHRLSEAEIRLLKAAKVKAAKRGGAVDAEALKKKGYSDEFIEALLSV